MTEARKVCLEEWGTWVLPRRVSVRSAQQQKAAGPVRTLGPECQRCLAKVDFIHILIVLQALLDPQLAVTVSESPYVL